MSKVSIGILHTIIHYNFVLFIKEVDLTYIVSVTKGFSGAYLIVIYQRVRNFTPSSEISVKYTPSHFIIMITICIREFYCIKV